MNASEKARADCRDALVFDRLVDGELDESARRALLRRLDHEPDGWKRCALAFIEAQAWRDAMAGGVASQNLVPATLHRPNTLAVLRQMLAVAAAVVVAFGLGFMSRGVGAGHGGVPGTRGGLAQGPVNTLATTEPVVTPPRTATETVPEYLRRRMERQGYRIDGDRKIVPVALEDGRKIAVPVETVSLKYVGQRIH